tara:strand:+ start:315 stop:428 length:114 start_codon:yes stop_codon:yes gene_type:complete
VAANVLVVIAVAVAKRKIALVNVAKKNVEDVVKIKEM